MFVRLHVVYSLFIPIHRSQQQTEKTESRVPSASLLFVFLLSVTRHERVTARVCVTRRGPGHGLLPDARAHFRSSSWRRSRRCRPPTFSSFALDTYLFITTTTISSLFPDFYKVSSMAPLDLPFAATLDVLASLLPEHLLKPRFGIVCGSGLSTLASSLRDVVEVPYSSLKGFGESTGMRRLFYDVDLGTDRFEVAGHKSSLAFGLIGEGKGVPVVAMLGRVCTGLLL